jgi:hypothetical protein
VVGEQLSSRSFRLRKRAALSRTYELSEGGVVVATLRLSSWTRSGRVNVNGHIWLLPAPSISNPRIAIVERATGEVLAEKRGRQTSILGRAGYRWRRTGLRAAWVLAGPDGRIVASFTRLRGAWRPSLTVEAMSGDERVDLICVVLGSRLSIHRRQQRHRPSGPRQRSKRSGNADHGPRRVTAQAVASALGSPATMRMRPRCDGPLAVPRGQVGLGHRCERLLQDPGRPPSPKPHSDHTDR